MAEKAIKPSLKNPFDPAEKVEFNIPGEITRQDGRYEEAMKEGYELMQRPVKSVRIDQIEKQHFKKRMTVWERIRVLTDKAAQRSVSELGQEPRRSLPGHRHHQHQRP